MADLDELVPTMGGLSWISGALFGLQGRWAEQMADAAATVHLAEHSRHHGWHATLWSEALPDSPVLAAGDHIVAPGGWEDAVRVADELEGDAARLAALYRVLVPRLAGALSDLAETLGGPGDRSIARTLGLVIADVDNDLRGGSARLVATLGDDDTIGMAASATKTLDQAFRT